MLSFDALQAEAESRYAGVELETRSGQVVTLRSLVMLSKTARKNAEVLLDSLKDKNGGTDRLEQVCRDFLALVADDPAAVKAEVKDWPLAMLLVAMERYAKDTQVGEA